VRLTELFTYLDHHYIVTLSNCHSNILVGLEGLPFHEIDYIQDFVDILADASLAVDSA
jgi:hypothetical protein